MLDVNLRASGCARACAGVTYPHGVKEQMSLGTGGEGGIRTRDTVLAHRAT